MLKLNDVKSKNWLEYFCFYSLYPEKINTNNGTLLEVITSYINDKDLLYLHPYIQIQSFFDYEKCVQWINFTFSLYKDDLNIINIKLINIYNIKEKRIGLASEMINYFIETIAEFNNNSINKINIVYWDIVSQDSDVWEEWVTSFYKKNWFEIHKNSYWTWYFCLYRF